MGIANENLTKEARKRFLTHVIDIDAANVQATAFVDNDCATKVNKITFVYSVASDTGTVPEDIQVGTAAAATLYFAGPPVVSKALGTVVAQTVASTALLPAGTALVINKSAATGGTNTGEVTVVVELETIDRIRSL